MLNKAKLKYHLKRPEHTDIPLPVFTQATASRTLYVCILAYVYAIAGNAISFYFPSLDP